MIDGFKPLKKNKIQLQSYLVKNADFCIIKFSAEVKPKQKSRSYIKSYVAHGFK